VADVQEGLRLQPGRWLGQRLRVRGLVVATCGFPDAQGHDGSCLIAQPGEPSFGLVDRTTWDPDVDLKRSLPVWPVRPSESVYGSLVMWLHLRAVPHHKLLSMDTGICVVALREEKPCQALAWARPCGVAELAM